MRSDWGGKQGQSSSAPFKIYTAGQGGEKKNAICECGVTEHEETVIWISTSLVEASLDIDFDYLFTEVQDIPSFIAENGEGVNRKGKKGGRRL